jgi:hypothetical protein
MLSLGMFVRPSVWPGPWGPTVTTTGCLLQAARSQSLVVGGCRKVADQIWLGARCILTWVSRSANPAER